MAIPSNINPLSSIGYQLNIEKLPELTFFAQEVNLPGITLGEPEYGTPFARVPIPGETLTYDQFSISFLVDEEMKNYKAIYNWIVALGFPEGYQQYLELKSGDNIQLYSELASNYSDASLIILNNNNNLSNQVNLRDIFPTALDSLTFQSTNNESQYLVGRVSFKFSYYNFD